MARPRTKIDYTEVEKLGMLQCTDVEVAAWFNVTTRCIEKWRVKDPHFVEALENGKAKGRISVRRKQMQLLENGNATMAVWLGKQLLGQRDMVSSEISGLNGGAIQTSGQMRIELVYVDPESESSTADDDVSTEAA